MPSATNGQLPADINGFRSTSAYVPGSGTVALQGGAITLDSTNTPSAPLVTNSQIRDTNNNAFGTTANPIATNQVVGTPIYATATLAAATGGNVSLAGVAAKTTYINGFYVSIGHASAGTPAAQVTVSLDGGTTTHMNFLIAASTSYPGLVQLTFPDPIPAIAANTAIKVSAPALTNGGIGSITAFGYQL